MIEMYKRALKAREAGLTTPKAEIPKVPPKQAPAPIPVPNPTVVDHQSLAAGDDTWDGTEDYTPEPEVME